jgi:hypothetical protein
MRLIFSVFILLGILHLFQCTSDKDSTSSYIDGAWKAEWFLSDKDMQKMFSSTEITMNGRMVFDQNNTVEITAFGFDGCVFASDTAKNNLKYDFQDSLLNLINGEKEVVFSYRVKEKLPDKLALVLMDDILLTLHR